MAPATSDNSGIGPRVRAARKRLGWSREALAFHAEISWSAIAQVESGRRTNLRPSTLIALSRALGVTVDYLITGSLSQAPMLEHSAFLYGADDQFQTTMGSFLAEGLERAEATLAVTTKGNIELLREQLGKDARQVEFVVSKDWLTTPAAALEEFRSFSQAKVADGAAWVRFISELIWDMRSDPEVRLWTRFESLFNLLFATAPLTVVCPYDERAVAPEILTEAHLTHPGTLDDAGVSRNPDYSGPGRMALDL